MTDDGSGGVDDAGSPDDRAGDGVTADERVGDALASGSVGEDEPSADGADADGATAGETTAATDDAPAGTDTTGEEMDPGLEDVVEYELADLEGEEGAEEVQYPSMDDPVAPQSIDLENAAFVVLGVVATAGLFTYMILGVV